MLADRGNTIELHVVDNDSITGVEARALTAIRSFYSKPSYNCPPSDRRISPRRPPRPQLLSDALTSIYFAAADNRIPVVQTLHNYRLLCAGSSSSARAKPAKSVLKSALFCPASSTPATAAVASVAPSSAPSLPYTVPSVRGRTVLIATSPSPSSLHRTGRASHPARQNPHQAEFRRDQGIGSGKGGFVLFVGRLSPEKGLSTILSADQASHFHYRSTSPAMVPSSTRSSRPPHAPGAASPISGAACVTTS